MSHKELKHNLLVGICIALLLAFLGEGWYVGQFRSELMETKMQLADALNRIAHLEHQSRVPFEPSPPNDPYADQQWALTEVEGTTLWLTTTGDREILVAVLDTGIDADHEDLEGKVAAEANFTDSPTPHDVYGHGTHIAGIIAANSNNGIGITGIAPESRLMNVKVANDKRQCQGLALAQGIIWAVDNGARVINISIELAEPSAQLEDAVNYAWSQGVLIIAAAGNQGGQSPVYPAFYENCIAVTATRQDGTLAPLSNYGDWVDFAAPGFNIYSTLPDNRYGYKSGTSVATAHISGLAALLFDVVSDTNGDNKANDEVRAALESAYSMKRLRS